MRYHCRLEDSLQAKVKKSVAYQSSDESDIEQVEDEVEVEHHQESDTASDPGSEASVQHEEQMPASRRKSFFSVRRRRKPSLDSVHSGYANPRGCLAPGRLMQLCACTM